MLIWRFKNAEKTNAVKAHSLPYISRYMFENLNNDKTRTYKTFSNKDDHAFTRCTMLITAMSECATNSVKIDMDDETRTEFM